MNDDTGGGFVCSFSLIFRTSTFVPGDVWTRAGRVETRAGKPAILAAAVPLPPAAGLDDGSASSSSGDSDEDVVPGQEGFQAAPEVEAEANVAQPMWPNAFAWPAMRSALLASAAGLSSD